MIHTNITTAVSRRYQQFSLSLRAKCGVIVQKVPNEASRLRQNDTNTRRIRAAIIEMKKSKRWLRVVSVAGVNRFLIE